MIVTEMIYKEQVYIGESENVKARLVRHMRDYSADKEKYFWNIAVIFLGRDLNKTLIRYLEDRCVSIARERKIPFSYLHGVNMEQIIKQVYESGK